MSSRSDRQSSSVLESLWLGALNIERNFPPKIRVMGDSTDLTYSRHEVQQSIHNKVKQTPYHSSGHSAVPLANLDPPVVLGGSLALCSRSRCTWRQ